MDYTVIGDHVNLASRLEGLNKIYSTDILIGDTTAKQIGSRFLVRPVDWVAVKGKSESGLVHHLICLKEEASQDQQQGVAAYIEAFKLYESRQFIEAKSKFDRANELLGGNDGPSLVLAERCLSYAKDPPPSTWKGFFIAKEK
jgi:adenylate cyclase